MLRRRILLLAILWAPALFAATLNITVKDPSGALVLGANVAVAPQPGGAGQNQNTDLQGHTSFDLPAGQYHVSVSHTGFENAERDATIANRTLDLTFTLKITAANTTMQISAKRSPLADSDPNYQALRKGHLTQVYRVSNFTITRDVGTFTFRSGAFSFLPPVLGHVTTGVFVGDGNFQLKPAFDLATDHLHRMMGADAVSEDFTAMVVYFSDSTFDEVKKSSQLADESTLLEEEALKRVKDLLETRRAPNTITRPLTMLERMLTYEDIPNYEAEVLEELYNGENPGSFRAFVRGKKYSDLRFLDNPHGAMPTLPAPEEVALLDFDPSSFSDGVWYLSHYATELRAGRASSTEDKRLIAPEHYKLDTLVRRENALGNIPALAVTCNLRFHAVQDGVRMVKFDMVPDLQVNRVTFNGNDIPFVQESRSHDGSFYLQMPEPLVKDRIYDVAFEYSGGEIVQSNYAIPPRRIWYPTPAGASSRATYDMTFRIPHRDHVIATGELENQSQEGGYDTAEYVSNQPIAQAVFRYSLDEGASIKSEVEQTTNTPMTAMVATGGRGMIPPSLNNVLTDIGNSLRVFHEWFGKPGYPGITVCVGCGFDSAPGLVSVPASAIVGFGSAFVQGMVMSGGRGSIVNARGPAARPMYDEAFPTQMSRQWWGNTVSPVSFHDTWLTSGLTSFSASLFDTEANEYDDYKGHWSQAHDAVLLANRQGYKANEVGPVWLSLLNETGKTPGASGTLNTSKGAFIIQMLRSLFWDPHTGDADFQATIQDFLKQFTNQAVSSEEFQAVVEKHMKPGMDLDRNHRMDWFFREWLLTTDVPSYRLEYQLTPQKGGKVTFEGKLTQSGVPANFKMLVPVFGDFSGRKDRILVVAMGGSSSGEFKVELNSMPKRILLNINRDILTYKDEVTQMKR